MRPKVTKSQVAESVPFDNTETGKLSADNTQGAIDEIATTYLKVDGTPSPGHQIIYNGTTGKWESVPDIGISGYGFIDRTAADSTISFNNSTRTFTIAPTGASFSYHNQGIKYTKTSADTVTIADTEGTWFIYYAGTTLTASQTPWSISGTYTFVAILYWDADNNEAIILGCERHDCYMDRATHERLHQVEGTKISKNGFTIGNYTLGGDGSSDSHAQISIGDGKIYDENLVHNVVNSATPTNPFEQKLSTVAYLPVFHRSGASAWRKIAATAYPIATNGSNPIYYNLNTAGSWSLSAATNGYFVPMWVYATNNINEPIIAILGQSQYASLGDAVAGVPSDVDVSGLPFAEFKLLYRLIFQTSTSFSNTPKAVLARIGVAGQEDTLSATGVTPPFVFSKDGNLTVNSYLRTGSVPTNTAGQDIKGSNYVIEIRATNDNNVGSTTRIQFQRRTALNTFTDITGCYVDIQSGTYRGSRQDMQVAIGPDWEIAAYNKSGSTLSNVVVTLYMIPQ